MIFSKRLNKSLGKKRGLLLPFLFVFAAVLLIFVFIGDLTSAPKKQSLQLQLLPDSYEAIQQHESVFDKSMPHTVALISNQINTKITIVYNMDISDWLIIFDDFEQIIRSWGILPEIDEVLRHSIDEHIETHDIITP